MKLLRRPPAARPAGRRVAVGATAAVFGLSTAFASGLVTAAHAEAPATLTDIVLGVGSAESQRVVSWYASADTVRVTISA